MRIKIGLITIHRVLNYGTVWQVFSTVQLLRQFGCEVEVIDYIPNRLKISNTKDFLFEINPKYKGFKKILYLFFKIPTRYLEKKAFDTFINKNIPLTKRYNTVEELQEVKSNYDIYITGSDQVWNYEEEIMDTIDPAYLLSFVSEEKTKIAFSASFGREKFNKNILDNIQKYILNYNGISVREKSGLDILKKINYKDAINLFDPTILFGKDKLIPYASKRLFNKPYLLIYSLSPNPLIDNLAKFIATKKNLKIIKLCNTLENNNIVDKYYRFRKPEDFLSLFLYADYIVTNSFHGTAFSVNFNKEFSTVCADKFEARMIDFLDELQLSNRLIKDETEFTKQLDTINYININEKLKESRNEMKVFLQDNINGIKL